MSHAEALIGQRKAQYFLAAAVAAAILDYAGVTHNDEDDEDAIREHDDNEKDDDADNKNMPSRRPTVLVAASYCRTCCSYLTGYERAFPTAFATMADDSARELWSGKREKTARRNIN